MSEDNKLKRNKFDPEKAEVALWEIASGGTLSTASKKTGIPKATLGQWMLDRVYDKYMAAREIRAVIHVDELRDYSQDMIGGKMDVAVFRELKDMNKWQAAHENSKLFGQRHQVDVGVKQVSDFLDNIPE